MGKKVLALVLCLAVETGSLLVGCQSTSDNRQNALKLAEIKSTPVFDNSRTYTFGVVAPKTGNYAEYGAYFDIATQLAAEKVNAAGGVNGKKIKLNLQDSKGDPKESTEIARKLSQDKEIIAVVGDFTSSCCKAAAPIYGEAGLVQLSPTASCPDYTAMNEYMFGMAGRQDTEAPFVAKFLAKEYFKTKKTGVIYLNNDWGISVKQNLVKTCNKVGIEVTAIEPFFDGKKDFMSELTKIRQTKPDTICLAMFYNEAVIISKQIKQMGWNDLKVAVVGPGYSRQIIDLGKDDVEGLASSTPFVIEDSNQELIEFARNFEKRAGFEPSFHAACAYDSVMLLVNAMKRCKKVDRKSIRDVLALTESFVGITGPIKFSPYRDVNRKYRIIAIENGEWVVKSDYDTFDQ